MGALSRRSFLQLAGGALAIGCTKQHDATEPDATRRDAGATKPDALVCPAQPFYPWFNAGPPGEFSTGVPVYFPSMENIGGDVYVVRDTGGLYALTTHCTNDPTLTAIQGAGFACPTCGSRYALDGTVVSGPATKPLQHLVTCIFGDLLVKLDEPVDPTARS